MPPAAGKGKGKGKWHFGSKVKYYPNRKANVSYRRCNNRNRIHALNLKYDRDVGRTGRRQCPFCQTHRNNRSVHLEYNTLAKHATMCDERDTWSIEDPNVAELEVLNSDEEDERKEYSIVVVVPDSVPKQFLLHCKKCGAKHDVQLQFTKTEKTKKQKKQK